MACYHPITGWRDPDGGQVRWDTRLAAMGDPIKIACGRCVGCRLERSRSWAVRCMHENQMAAESCFITLTYNDDHLPVDESLDVAEFQRFMKRLRNENVRDRVKRNQDPKPVRYFMCGEYGDLYGRPHYHALLWGEDFGEDRVLEEVKRGVNLFTSPRLARLWRSSEGKTLGLHRIGEVTFESAAYVARYCMKKVNGIIADEHYTWINEDGVQFRVKEEYVSMSRGGTGGGGGIGSSWLKKFQTDVYPEDVVFSNGMHKSRPPKYYDGQFEVDHPERMEEIRERRVEFGRKHQEHRTPERLKVRENIMFKKLRLLRRGLDV